MSLKTIHTSFVVGFLTLVTMSVVCTSSSRAAKPSGGGGTASTGGGTIYFTAGSGATVGLVAMNSDGTGKTALPLNVRGTPSRLLHEGHRWFLTSRTIAGETYPNGSSRGERFAVRGDGNESVTVQLTNDPDLQFLSTNWAPGETSDAGLLSGLARRWVFDGVDWVIDPDSVGIYGAMVLFDDLGDVIGLAAAPDLLVSVGVLPGSGGSWWPDVSNWQFDWSPDLTEVVYSTDDRSDLLVQDVNTGAVRSLTTGGNPYGAKWSPVDDLIVFGTGYGSIHSIAPNGSGRKEIVRAGNYYYGYPEISPTGSYVIYQGFPAGWFEESDLFRATIGGKSAANLTKGIPGRENIVNWR